MKTNILIVDDDREIAQAIAFYLRNEGYEPIIALDGIVDNPINPGTGNPINSDLGWRGGRRFVEDVASDDRVYEDAEPASGRRFLALSVATDGDLVPRTAEFTCESGPCFSSLAAHPPRFLCDSSWNLVKVVRRGASAADELCAVENSGPRFELRVR